VEKGGCKGKNCTEKVGGGVEREKHAISRFSVERTRETSRGGEFIISGKTTRNIGEERTL